MTADADVRELLGDIAAVADELGDAEAARQARAETASVTAHAARVVVVGEQKRGKSSLINALLRMPGLLPVDADIATSVHLTVSAADEAAATVFDDEHLIDGEPGGGFRIPLSAIGEYAALDPASGEMRHPGVREVSVGLPSDLLRPGLQLIDTPGVGGLEAGHAQLTLAALSRADVLLFVVSGAGELSKSEYEFLRQATERIATVAFVLTQTDKYPSWPRALDANRKLIDEHAPQLSTAPWYPVSSMLRSYALEAAALGRAQEAAAQEERSGLRPLEALLTSNVAGRAAGLRGSNAVLVALRLIQKLSADAGTRLRSLDRDPELAAEVAARQAELVKYKADARWQRELDTEFARLGKEMSRLYQRRVVEVQAKANKWIAMADNETAHGIAHDLDAELRSMWADLVAAAQAGSLAIAARITDSVRADGVDALLDADLPYPEQLASAGQFLLAGDGPAEGFSEKVTRLWPSLSGFSMTTMAAHMLLGLAVPPLALVSVGGLAAYILYQGNSSRASTARARAELQRHVQGELSRAGVEMLGPLLDGVEAAHRRIRTAISERMDARERELNEALARAKRDQVNSEQERRPERDKVMAALARLQVLGKRAQTLTASTPRPSGTSE